MASHVLRVPLDGSASDADEAVLVHVRGPSLGTSGNDGSVELVIEGTEGETPYVAKFKSADLNAARATNGPIAASEWNAILSHLLQDGPLPADMSSTTNLSLGASLDTAHSLTLHVRQTVASIGITQRLGELTLRADPDHEIDTLAWTVTAIQRSEALSQQRAAAEARATACEERVRSLTDQLAELVSVKRASEDEMLVAFADVLNAKKRKVRELQRMVDELKISGGSGNAAHDEHGEKNENDNGDKDRSPSTSKHAPGASRAGKRKANAAAEEAHNEDENGKMVLDGNYSAEVTGDDATDDETSNFERMGSPSRNSDVDEESGEEAEEIATATPAAEPVKRRMGTIGGIKSAAPAKKPQPVQAQKAPSDDKAQQNAPDSQTVSQEPPSRRELPFTRRQEALQKQQEGGGDAGEETSDDEL